jgi:peptide/nickel transport system permease protein
MLAYVTRRLLLMIPTVLGVMLLTFVLFSIVAKDPARAFAGKNATEEVLKATRAKMGLNKPRFLDLGATTRPILSVMPGNPVPVERPPTLGQKMSGLFNTQFFDLLLFRFPQSMRYERSVWSIIAEKAPVSLAIQVPAFVIALGIELAVALIVASRRGGALDHSVTLACVASLALPALSLYIFLQWLLGAKLAWFPVAGWEPGIYLIQYAALPVLCSVVLYLGGGIRFYRTVILEEINADYVRTARGKGVSNADVLLVHVMRNVMIPVITNTITALPGLIFGALILERLFQIPGLGSLLVDAIFNQDRTVVMAVTYIVTVLNCLALLASDVLYTVADPRISLQ